MDAPSMRGPYAASFALHAGIAAALTAGVALTATVVQHQEQVFQIAEAKKQAAVEEEVAKEAASAAAEAAKTQVALSVTDLIAGHVSSPDAEAIIAASEQGVEDLFRDAADHPEAGGEADTELMAQAERKALEQALVATDQRLQTALVAQVRQHIRNEVVPEIDERVERELKQKFGEELKQQVEQAIRDDKRTRLTALAEQVRNSAQKMQEAAAQSDLRQVREGVTTTEQQVRAILDQALAQAPQVRESAQLAAADHEVTARIAAETDLAKAKKMAANRAEALASLAKDLEKQAGRSEIDPVQQRIAAKVQNQLATPVATAARTAIEQQVIPQAAARITETVGKDLDRLKLPREQFQAAVTADIAKALQQELPAIDTASTAAAWMKTGKSMGFRQTTDLTATRQQVEQAADALEKLVESQQSASVDDPQAQRARVGAIAKATADARASLGEARSASLTADDQIEKGLQRIRAAKAEDHAQAAAVAMEKRLDEQARNSAAAAVKDLKSTVESLRHVGEALTREETARPTPPPASVRELAAQPDAAGSEQSAKNISGAIQANVSHEASAAVERVSSQIKSTDVLSQDERVAQLMALRAQLGAALQQNSDPRAMGASQLASGLGSNLVPSRGGDARARGVRRMNTHWNRELYEAFVKDLRGRTNPSTALDAPAAPAELETSAEPSTVAVPAVVYVSLTPESKSVAKPESKPRQLPTPTFTSPVVGYASYQATPLTLDGDLADWGPLAQPLTLQWNADNTKCADGPTAHLRWSNQGVYLAYTVQDPTGIQLNKLPWSGDCVELWLDTDNARKAKMSDTPTAQQLCFIPFGMENDPKVTFCEIGRGFRGINWGQWAYDSEQKRGWSVAKAIPGGYTVEAFVRREALAKPILLPGMWLAVNLSVNTGIQGQNGRETQWSASKGINTWDRPDTWGDVLLLGADATIAFKSRPVTGEITAIEHLVVGQSFTIEIADADLNLDAKREDRIAATVEVPDRDEPVLAVLKETGPDTGIFRASLATRPREDEPAPNVIRVRPGEKIRVIYQDARAAFGEAGREVTADLPVAVPVMRFGKH